MIGDGSNIFTVLFILVIALAVVGAVIARLRAAGMALTMASAGIAHLAVAIAGATLDARGAVLSATLAGIWLFSAACFTLAARKQACAT